MEPQAMTDREALLRFLQDIQCLDRLDQWSNQFNLFDVLRVSGAEIRHSNVLAWLLDPGETHGLGDAVLRRLVQLLTRSLDEETAFRLLMLDLDDCTVRREVQHTDLLVVSETQQFYLCIENKVFSGEHSNQLHNYHEALTRLYPGYLALFVYLTPEGDLPLQEEDQAQWQTLSYPEVLELLEAALQGKTPAPEISFFIHQYMDAIRRTIVGDPELERICREIYAQHRQALDLIYESRPDDAQEAAGILREWCTQRAQKGLLVYDPDFSTKSYIRFTTPRVSALLPDHTEALSGWKSPSMYFYEICNHGNSLGLILTVCRDNLTEEQLQACEALFRQQKKPAVKASWRWRRLYSISTRKLKNPPQTDERKTEIFAVMDSFWANLVKFEATLPPAKAGPESVCL